MRTAALARPGRLDVIVVGAGQAGLAMGRELERAGRDFLILDGAREIGDSWRTRWDSLRLFTPAAYSGLPGIPFPATPEHLPTKDEVASYLGAYARAFSMPIALDEPVRELRARGPYDHTVTTDYARYRARHVVIATGGHRAPLVPAFAATLAPGITQLHSSEYRAPAQLPPGPVLVVGGANSGVQIAAELAATHEVTLALGRRMVRLPQQLFGKSIFHWLELTGAFRIPVTSYAGRRASRVEHLIGVSPRDLARRLGVRVVPRMIRAEGRGLRASDGSLVRPRTVIWATGFRPSFPWLRAPVLDGSGGPAHTRGITAIPGLSFLGLPWQHTRGSSLLGWVARDAEFLADAIIRADSGGAARADRLPPTVHTNER